MTHQGSNKTRKRKAVGFSDIFHYNNQMDLNFGQATFPSKLPDLAQELDDSSSSDDEEFPKRNSSGKTAGKVDRKHQETLEIDDEECLRVDETSDDSPILNNSIDNPPSPPPPPQVDTPTLIKETFRRKGSQKLREVESTLFLLKQTSESQSSSPLPPSCSRPYLQDDIVILDDDVQVCSPVKPSERDIVVKVRTRSGLHRFNMKAGDPFNKIVPELACREGIPEEKVLLTLRGEGINLWSSPHMLGVTVADILECITAQNEVRAEEDDNDDEDSIEVKIQGANAKQTKTFKIRIFDPLEKLMVKYCSVMNLPQSRVHFSFDGDEIKPGDTADSLEMDDGSMIDVKVK